MTTCSETCLAGEVNLIAESEQGYQNNKTTKQQKQKTTTTATTEKTKANQLQEQFDLKTNALN